MARKLGRLKIVGLRIGGQGIGTAGDKLGQFYAGCDVIFQF